jgi:hypothetical protein
VIALGLLADVEAQHRRGCVAALAPHLGAVALDLPTAAACARAGELPGRCGLAVEIGEAGWTGRLDASATPAAARHVGASAAYLRLAIHPEGARRAARTVRTALALCAEEDLPLVVDVRPVRAPGAWFSARAADTSRAALDALGPLQADLLVLPIRAGEGSPAPWICGLASSEPPELARELEAAMALGARGFAVGAALIPPAVDEASLLEGAAPVAAGLRELAVACRVS